MTHDFKLYALLAILVSGAATFLTRLLPFALFKGKRSMPKKLKKIAEILPSAIIAVLLIYGMSSPLAKGISSSVAAIIALSVAILFHLKWHNTLLSMFSSTAAYMLLIKLL